MLKGAIGLKTIFGLVLGMMVLGLVGTAVTVGDLGNIIQQGLDDSSAFTDFTTEIDASDERDSKETFSDLAMFVRDRSVKCNRVEARNDGVPIGDASGQPYRDDGAEDDPKNSEAEGYPGLEDTRLGIEPICTGGSSTIVRDRYDWVPTRGWLGGGPEDNAMPGTLSRERFKITGDHETDSLYFEDRRPSTEDGETEYELNKYWLENNIGGVSNQRPEDHIIHGHEFEQSGTHGGSTMEGGSSAYGGTGRNSIVFFETSVGDSRTNGLLSDMDHGDLDFGERVWAQDCLTGHCATGDSATSYWDIDDNRYFAHELLLCPGDEGYIQVNRDTPTDTGVADTSGRDNYYPMIVITDTEFNSCDGHSLGGEEEYGGPLTANQLFIKSGVGDGDDFDLPDADNFELKQYGDRQGANWIRPYVEDDMEGDENRCEIYFHQTHSPALQRDGSTLRTYSTGRMIERDESDFDLSPSSSTDRHYDDGGGPEPTYDAHDLINDLNLNGGEISSEGAGELRPQTDTSGENELYGDLLCGNPEDEDYAKWHLCHEDLDEDRREFSIGGIDWSCNPGITGWSFTTGGGL